MTADSDIQKKTKYNQISSNQSRMKMLASSLVERLKTTPKVSAREPLSALQTHLLTDTRTHWLTVDTV